MHKLIPEDLFFWNLNTPFKKKKKKRKQKQIPAKLYLSISAEVQLGQVQLIQMIPLPSRVRLRPW